MLFPPVPNHFRSGSQNTARADYKNKNNKTEKIAALLAQQKSPNG
jgi:hypothetical protein